LEVARIDLHRTSTNTTPGTLTISEQGAGNRFVTPIGNAFTYTWPPGGGCEAADDDRDFTATAAGWTIRLICRYEEA
jgi:hypothetical protein